MNATGWASEAIQMSQHDNRNGTSAERNFTGMENEHAPACATPCVSIHDTTSCPTLACSLDTSYKSLCRSFTRNAIVGCYCKATLNDYVSNYGITAEMFNEFSSDTGAVCQEFLGSYAATMSLSFGMSFVLVLVNGILRILLTLLARCEHHHSEGAESAAVSLKVFTAQFMNTGLTMLVVNAALQQYLPR